MKAMIIIFCAGALTLTPGAFGQHSHAENEADKVMHTHHPAGESNGTPGAITGYVRDVACLLRNGKAGGATTPLTQDCMRKCVRDGSPVGILAEDGLLYLPVSDLIPDKTVRDKMLPYVGKYVKVNGALLERGGLHAIAIEKIEVTDRPADSKIPVS